MKCVLIQGTRGQAIKAIQGYTGAFVKDGKPRVVEGTRAADRSPAYALVRRIVKPLVLYPAGITAAGIDLEEEMLLTDAGKMTCEDEWELRDRSPRSAIIRGAKNIPA